MKSDTTEPNNDQSHPDRTCLGLGAALAGELQTGRFPLLGLARRTDTGLPEAVSGLIEQVALDLADSAALGNWLTGRSTRRLCGGAEYPAHQYRGGARADGRARPAGPRRSPRGRWSQCRRPLMISSAPLAAPWRAENRAFRAVPPATPTPAGAIYCATMAALDHHARAVTLDGDARLRICSLAPGVIDTDMRAEIRETPVGIFPMQDRFVALKQDGQLASPRDVASRLVRYLLGKDFGAEPVADLRSLPETG